jgi:hypothetical protein
MTATPPIVAGHAVRPAMEQALGKLVMDDDFRDAFFVDPDAASRAVNIELTERERNALARIRPGALAAFRSYLDRKWTFAARALAEPVPGRH